MHMFAFVVDSVPLPDNRNYSSIGGAKVHVWVKAQSQDIALSRAIEYIKGYLWEPKEIEHAFEISPEQLSQMHKDEAALCRTAMQVGIAADFLGWLKDPAPADYPTILWRP